MEEREQQNNYIAKTLKFGNFIYDEERDVIIVALNDKDGNLMGRLEFNKIYAFAFYRFVTRIAQRNWFRHKRKVVSKK